MNGDYDDLIDDALDEAHDDSAELFEFDVAKMVHSLEVKREAQRRIALKGRDTADWDVASLEEVLARQAPPPARVSDLIPSDAGTLLVAQRKVGKTTWLLNLARALIVGGTFLGRFEVQPVAGTIAYLNFEVSGWTLARWADEVGVPRDRLVLVNLRGARNPLSDPQDRAELAETLRSLNCEVIIVDPFGRAFDGANQNDVSEVGPWLNRLDRWARSEVGARDVILTAHAGWNGERSRGSSALEDWADSIINLTKDADDQRYMRAIGRDVDQEEDRLEFDAGTRLLTLTGTGSRASAGKAQRRQDLTAGVLDLVAEEPGINGTVLEDRLRKAGLHFQKSDGRDAANDLVAKGRLVSERGPKNSICYLPIRPSDAHPSSPKGSTDEVPESGKTPSQSSPEFTQGVRDEEQSSSPKTPGEQKPLVSAGIGAVDPSSPELTPGNQILLTQLPYKGSGSAEGNTGRTHAATTPAAADLPADWLMFSDRTICKLCGSDLLTQPSWKPKQCGDRHRVQPDPEPDPPADRGAEFMAYLEEFGGGAA